MRPVADRAMQEGQRLAIVQESCFRKGEVEQIPDRLRLFGEALQIEPIIDASSAAGVKHRRLNLSGLLAGRQKGEGAEISALKAPPGLLEALAAFFIDQPRQCVRPQTVGVIVHFSTARLHMQTPARAKPAQRCVEARAGAHQFRGR